MSATSVPLTAQEKYFLLSMSIKTRRKIQENDTMGFRSGDGQSADDDFVLSTAFRNYGTNKKWIRGQPELSYSPPKLGGEYLRLSER